MSPLLGTNPVAVPDPLHLEGWEENDEPLASDFHLWEQDRCYDVLRTLYAGPHCYVSMNRWLAMGAHWPHPLQPDLLVALGVPHRNRDVYDPALEGKAPDLLAEYLSPRSQTGDLGEKLRLYALVGAREFWVFNPSGRFALPRIQAWRLDRSGTGQRLSVAPDGSVASEVMPVRFALIDDLLAVLDRETGAVLTAQQAAELRAQEAIEARHAAELLAQHEAEARQAAVAEIRRLQEELDRLRRERL
jgi:Uma2 family endonuclease